MATNPIAVVDPDKIEQQLPDLLEEMLSGSGAIIIKDAFPTECDRGGPRPDPPIHHPKRTTRKLTSWGPAATRSTFSAVSGTC